MESSLLIPRTLIAQRIISVQFHKVQTNETDENNKIICSVPSQYSLLQTVVEACQKKRHCKFLSSPKTLHGDPCPAVRKFVEISYKCRPCK